MFIAVASLKAVRASVCVCVCECACASAFACVRAFDCACVRVRSTDISFFPFLALFGVVLVDICAFILAEIK